MMVFVSQSQEESRLLLQFCIWHIFIIWIIQQFCHVSDIRYIWCTLSSTGLVGKGGLLLLQLCNNMTIEIKWVDHEFQLLINCETNTFIWWNIGERKKGRPFSVLLKDHLLPCSVCTISFAVATFRCRSSGHMTTGPLLIVVLQWYKNQLLLCHISVAGLFLTLPYLFFESCSLFQKNITSPVKSIQLIPPLQKRNMVDRILYLIL